MGSLEDQIALVNKKIGAGTVRQVQEGALQVERIPCGILSVDLALGGGFPVGNIIEVSGVEGSGKSSLAMSLVGAAQSQGGKCVYIDVENAFTREMAESYGINVDELFFSQPSTAEDALETLNLVAQADDLTVAVVDSVAGLVPRAELEGNVGDSHVGLQARLMSQELRILAAKMRTSKSQPIVIFINQLREKVGGMPGFGGPQTTTPGGRALRFWSTVRMEVSRTKQIKPRPDEDPVGHEVRVKVTKNRTAPPLRTVGFDMLFDRGISKGSCILDLGIDYGFVKQSGAWFTNTLTGEKLGQGRQAVLALLDSDDGAEIAAELAEAITEAWGA